jgi:hypothetical protein
MKKRSRADGKPAEPRRRKTPKRRIAPKVARRGSSAADQETEVARLTHELNEALEQQTATTELLQVISSSAGDLQPVFQTMLAKAVRLCQATFGVLWLTEGDASGQSRCTISLPHLRPYANANRWFISVQNQVLDDLSRRSGFSR